MIEVDEFNHCDRNINDEIRMQNLLKERIGCKFIKIYPDKHHFNVLGQ